MPTTPRGKKLISDFPIPQHIDPRGSNAIYNKFNQLIWKIKSNQGFPNDAQFESGIRLVKSILRTNILFPFFSL